jgi:hypothetical protein
MDERSKGYLLVHNLIVSMLFVMVQKDFKQYPFTSPAGHYAVHGWLVFFLQVAAADLLNDWQIATKSYWLVGSSMHCPYQFR